MRQGYGFLLALCGLLPIKLHGAESDAAGCKDHPLLPRLSGYYIAACGAANASFDVAPVGDASEVVHIEGDSWAIAYSATAKLEPRPGREAILSRFENSVKQFGARRMGEAYSMPVYRLVSDGKEIWVVVMADAVGGGYGYRIIQKGAMVETREASNDDKLNCAGRYGPPPFAPLQGYEVCGCGGQASGAREFRNGKGKSVRVEGRVTQFTYCPKQEGSALGDTQIRRRLKNRVNAENGAPFGTSAKDSRITVYRLTKGGSDLWIETWTEEGGNYNCVVTRKGN